MKRDSPTAGELLSVWERALEQRGGRRALSLLGAACPGRSIEDLSRESVGSRDSLLLALRKSLFGSQIDCVMDCPGCRELLEFALVVDDLTADRRHRQAILSVASDRYSVRFRLPDSRDLLAVERDCANPEEAARSLLERCVVEATLDGEQVAPAQLPAVTVDLVDRAMLNADPQADIDVSLSCPQCGMVWNETFDIAGYLWEELDAWARRIVRDVHMLAAVYGWHEADILDMTAQRRGAYLELITA